MRIAIVGGSLIGPLAERLLRSIGYTDVVTYEAAPEARPQSGGVIGVRESGFKALDQAGVPLPEIVAYPGKDVITYNIDNRKVTGLRDRSIYPGETTAWDIFHHAVASQVDIQYDKKVTGLSPDGLLTFTSGRAVEVDWVIFADGRNSTGRRILDPSRTLTYQGYLVWRGVTDPADGVVGFTRYRNDEHGNLFSITEPIAQGSHVGKTDWTYYQNMTEERFTDLVGQSPTQKVFLLPHHFTTKIRSAVYDYVDQYLPTQFESTVKDTADLMAVPINDLSMPTRAAWRLGRVRANLLGDALMTVRPHSGRGINNGIDQLWSLMGHLPGPTGSREDHDQALNRWQMEVIPKVYEWVQLGLLRAQRNGLGVTVDGVPRG